MTLVFIESWEQWALPETTHISNSWNLTKPTYNTFTIPYDKRLLFEDYRLNMTNDMSLPTRLFYMLIVLNAPDTNLHCVYFAEHHFILATAKTRADQFWTLFLIGRIVINVRLVVKLSLSESRWFTRVTLSFQTYNSIFHSDENCVNTVEMEGKVSILKCFCLGPLWFFLWEC